MPQNALQQIAELTIAASKIREGSFRKGSNQAVGTYTLKTGEACNQALDEANITDPALRVLVGYLAYGEGVDVCHNVLKTIRTTG
jgi:hypothetical protein